MPGSFRVLHDAAARGELPDIAGVADAPAAPAEDVAAAVADNYGTYYGTAEQLRALQDSVREQAAIVSGDSGAPPEAWPK